VNDETAIVVTKLKRSAEIVFLTEAHARSDPTVFCYHDVWSPDFLPADANGRPRPGGPPSGPRILNDNRHGGRINLLFLDGHVSTKMFAEVRRRDFDFLYTGPR
jgi:prepilin-type processing-associated H-X9-DG protein